MSRSHCLLLITLLVVSLGTRLVSADERSPAELFPASTLVYGELRDPERLIDLVLNHPLRDEIEPLVREAYEQKQYLRFKAVVSIIEAQLGSSWPNLLANAAGEGVAIGFDVKTEGAAILLKSRDDSTTAKIIETIVGLARQEANNKGNPDPVKSTEYRGVKAYQIGEAKVAVSGRWLVITNKGDLGKVLLDNLLDKPDATLAADEQFQAARNASPSDAAAWGYVNIAALRNAGVAKDLFKGQTDNPLVELLIGGLMSNLQKTPFVTASLTATQNELGLQLTAPHDPAWVDESREYFFGPEGTGLAPDLLRAKNTLFSMSVYRDISQMWLRAGDLFDERVNDGLAQADNTLTTLFSGNDFGEDILGAVQPEVQLVVVRQDFKDGPRPAIQLPGFAMSFRLREPETMRSELRRTFQSLIGFLNVTGAMQGQPQLDLDIDKQGDLQIVSAKYIPEKDADLNRLRINFNFSPTVAFVGDRFIVSSSRQLARELAENQARGDDLPANTAAVADLRVLREILADNRGQLVARNMLKEGNTKEEAEAEIGMLLDLLGFLRSASLEFTNGDDQLRIALDLTLTAGD